MGNLNVSDYRFSFGDDPEFEDLTAEIYYKEEFIALISQDGGFESLKVHIYKSPQGEFWDLDLNSFTEAIAFAKQRLWELRKS